MNLSARRLAAIGSILAIAAYHFYLTRDGWTFPFDNDDMFNIYQAWSKPRGELSASLVTFWRPAFRPLGLIFHRSIFEVFGFAPLPFRVACFVLTTINLWLCYRLAFLVSNSARIAVLAALIFAYHSRLMEVWVRTAVVYDVLCFTFLYLGLCLYIAARKHGETLTPARGIAILFCYLAALDSKEMAVAFPVLLLSWELCFQGIPRHPKRSWIIAVAGIMAAIFLISKTIGNTASMNDPAFKPAYTTARFEQNWNGALTHLFLLTRDLSGPVCIFVLLGLLAIAVRSRLLLFAWSILFFGALPVIFIPPRGGYVLYISYVGWSLFAAVLLVAPQDLLLKKWPAIRMPLAVVVFALVAWRYGKANLHDQRRDKVKSWLYDSPRAIRTLSSYMIRRYPHLPQSAGILFLDDGFGTDEWTPVFVLRLLYEARDMRVDRMKMLDVKPADWKAYQYVFDYSGGEYEPRKQP